MSEKEEIESMRENGRTYSIEDISHHEQKQIAKRLRNLFNEAITRYEQSPSEIHIQYITICGSFAYGDALKYISDLDVRLVLNKDVVNNDKITDYIKKNYDTTDDDLFGFVDAQCHTNQSSDPEHVTIWTK